MQHVATIVSTWASSRPGLCRRSAGRSATMVRNTSSIARTIDPADVGQFVGSDLDPGQRPGVMADEHDRRRGGDGRRLDQDVVEVVVDGAERVGELCRGRRVASLEHVVDERDGADRHGVPCRRRSSRARLPVVDRDGQRIPVQRSRGSRRLRAAVGSGLLALCCSDVGWVFELVERPRGRRRRRPWRGDGRRGRGGTSRRPGCRRRRRTGGDRRGRRGSAGITFRGVTGVGRGDQRRRRSRARPGSTPPAASSRLTSRTEVGCDEVVARRHRGAVVEERVRCGRRRGRQSRRGPPLRTHRGAVVRAALRPALAIVHQPRRRRRRNSTTTSADDGRHRRA